VLVEEISRFQEPIPDNEAKGVVGANAC
jgi:hypothetical protein